MSQRGVARRSERKDWKVDLINERSGTGSTIVPLKSLLRQPSALLRAGETYGTHSNNRREKKRKRERERERERERFALGTMPLLYLPTGTPKCVACITLKATAPLAPRSVNEKSRGSFVSSHGNCRKLATVVHISPRLTNVCDGIRHKSCHVKTRDIAGKWCS